MPVQEADIFCRYLDLLENSGVGVFFQDEDEIGQGRPGFDPCALFAMVLFAFADNGGSLRDMERRCMFDCRYNYLARGDEGKIEITKLGNITFTNLGNGFMMKPERRAESNEPIARARTQGHQKHGNQA